MEPIIYALPLTVSTEITTPIFIQSNIPAPKLLKFGYNTFNDNLDLLTLTSNNYYRVGLSFDFERNDSESIKVKGLEKVKTKNFDLTFAEFWEITNIFKLLKENQDILTTHPDIIIDLVQTYKTFSKSTFTYTVNNKKQKTKSLIFYKVATSDIEVDENAFVQILINSLNDFFKLQSTGANVVIQIFSLQTQTLVDIIFYLSSFYTEAYLIKPTVTSVLTDVKYLVLLNLKKQTMDFSLPLVNNNSYISISQVNYTTMDFVNVIQCFNSEIIPKKFKKYFQIKSYLDTKVYEGSTFKEMIAVQNNNTNQWLDTFFDFDSVDKLLDNSLKKSNKSCVMHSSLLNLLA